MRSLIARYIRLKAILRVLEKFAELFTGKTEVVSAIETFADNTNRIGVLLAKLARSRKVLSAPKIDKEIKLRTSLFTLAGLGVTLGSRRKDTPQVNLFKAAKKGTWSTGAWAMLELARQAAEELADYPLIAVKIGVTTEILEAFQLQIQEFGDILDATDAQFKDRKSDRLELKALFSANSTLLKEQIEPVIRFEGEATPAVLREFLVARRSGARKKPEITEDLLVEISGTVTNIVTGLPVVNATVDIAERELITTTDADGYYQFDEVPVGDSIIGCNAPGFRVPEKVKVKAADGESLQVDFSLLPEAAE